MLNSKVIAYFFKKFYAGGGLGDSGYRYKKKFLLTLPIIQPTHEIEREFNCFYERKDFHSIEKLNQLENYILQLYDFNEEEKHYILKEIKLIN